MIDTVGTVSNRDGIGVQIRLVAESGAEQFGLVSTAGSYLSASDKRVHFGLGAETKAKLVGITWPSGVVQTDGERLGQPDADSSGTETVRWLRVNDDDLAAGSRGLGVMLYWQRQNSGPRSGGEHCVIQLWARLNF